MKTIIGQDGTIADGTIADSGEAQPDIAPLVDPTVFDPAVAPASSAQSVSTGSGASGTLSFEGGGAAGVTTPGPATVNLNTGLVVSSLSNPTVYAPLVITPVFGASVTNQVSSVADPTTALQIENAVSAAIAYYETNWTSSVPVSITNAVSVSIQFDYGFVQGTVIASGVSESRYGVTGIGNGSFSSTYSQLAGVLPHLPVSDPSKGGLILETTAQAQLLGISGATPGTPSGWVGLDTFNNVTLDYNLANQTIAGEVGAVGAIEHEISEVFGRVADLSQVPGAGNSESILDLYRFSAPNTPATTAGVADYFSLNNGTTSLGLFNNAANSGDAGDWASTVQGDAFDAFLTPGTAGTISSLDSLALSAIGFQAKPRTLVWTGAQGNGFATAADWNDLTNSLSPALTAPGAADTAEFLTSNGSISGSATAAALEFGGPALWNVTSGASLSALTGVTVGQGGTGALLVNAGATISGLGVADSISGAANSVASATVDGTGSTWNSAGELIVGGAGGGNLTISNAAHLGAAAAGALPALDLGSTGGTGGLRVTGAGSTATLLGQVNVGDSGGGTLTISNQATVLTGNDAALDPTEGLDIARLAGGSGGATVTGANTLLRNTGRFVVGDAGVGALSILAGGGVTTTPGAAPGLAGAVISNTAGASGSSVSVSGTGSRLSVAGALIVGAAGYGSLSLSQGATVTAASIDEASAAGGDGVISVAGTGSALTLTGSLTVGDQAAGEVSILNGATVSALNVTIGNVSTLSSGNVDIEGAGSELIVGTGGLLNVGVAGGGSGVLTIGAGTTLHSNAGVIEAGHASFNNNGGVVDPPFVDITTTSNSGLGSNLYDLYVENIGAVQIVSGTGTWDTPMLLTGTSVADAQNNINVNGDVGEWQLSSGGTLIVNANTVDSGQAIVFEDATDTLVIGQIVNNGSAGVSGTAPVVDPGAENLLQAGGFAAAIWGYVAGDQILFDNMSVSSASVVNGNTVDLFGPGNVSLGSLAFFTKSGSKVSNAGATAAALQIPCFAEGTRIETAGGLVKVEDLRVGDRVLTAGGVPEPIVWLGQRTVNCARHPAPDTVWPVRVQAGAFGEAVPVRDLYLSPDHAVFLNNVLVPVKLLINGTSITQVERSKVTYYHVELSRHAVILAEGLPVESYLDTGDRVDFSNAGPIIRLFPDFGATHAAKNASLWETKGAAPLVMAGKALDAARTCLANRSVPPDRHDVHLIDRSA